MKLIKSIQLFYQEGNSDKVYNIELLETSDNAYVVNFKYGRRGSSLKEGTKTVFSVERGVAENIFTALEDEKRRKGYLGIGDKPNLKASLANGKTSSDSVTKKHKLIVKLLKAAVNDEEHESWPLTRIIWKTGELNIKEATPWVLKLVDKNDHLQLYACIWSLSRIGDHHCISFFNEIINGNFPNFITNLAQAALLNHCDEGVKKIQIEKLIASLPASLNQAMQADDMYLKTYLNDHFTKFASNRNDFLVPLYFVSIENKRLRQYFLKYIALVPLKAGYFKYVRQLFKISEMLYDTELYGILAKNIEKAPSNFTGEQVFLDNQWVISKNELATASSRLAFSKKTKDYFGRRIVRTLRKLGEEKSKYYTKFATEVLLAYDDSLDMMPPDKTTKWEYYHDEVTDRYSSNKVDIWFDSYANYRSFNYILFANSARFSMQKSSGKWQCVPPYFPGANYIEVREEAFGVLWNSADEDIIKLLTKSKCSRVVDFALLVFENNQSFKEKITEENIICFINSFSIKVQQLAIKLIKENYHTSSIAVVVALLLCEIEEGKLYAQNIIDKSPLVYVNNIDFLSAIIFDSKSASHLWLQGFLLLHKPEKEVLEKLLNNLINHLLLSQVKLSETYTDGISELIDLFFKDVVKSVENKLIFDLLLHHDTAVQGLVGKLLVLKKLDSKEVEDAIIFKLLASENKIARGAAIDLLNQMSEAEISTKQSLILSLCLSSLQDVRQSAQKLIDKLLIFETSAGYKLVELFLPVLTVKEKYEGLHQDILNLITDKLSSYLNQIPVKQILSLCVSRYIASQELGSFLLEKNVDSKSLSIKELNVLANSDLLKNRQYVMKFYVENLSQIKEEKKTAILLCDSIWADVRIFAFDYFNKNFDLNDWEPVLFITLCDSIKPDVQAYGREMITKWFEKDQGFDYLLQLSQHPDQRMQLFASGFLEQYATNNIEMITKLGDFFIPLLSQINKGRTAKLRAVNLLIKEALSNEQHAILITSIFNRMSATAAIQDKAIYIKALFDIGNKFPSISSFLKVNASPIYKPKQLSHAV